jgi:hypothetical protein
MELPYAAEAELDISVPELEVSYIPHLSSAQLISLVSGGKV